ncbi:MAG: hypothetical protein PHQ70_05985 [Arcobacter sp.]|nr:hypothetical protein [Arcobacter sp.]
MNLKYIVKMDIDKNYKIKYTPFKKSTNEKYNQVIEDFIRQENGKIYFFNVDKKSNLFI